MISLIKVTEDNPSNLRSSKARLVKCPNCEQTYRLIYGDSESHHLNAWLKKADAVLRKSHKKAHETAVLELH